MEEGVLGFYFELGNYHNVASLRGSVACSQLTIPSTPFISACLPTSLPPSTSLAPQGQHGQSHGRCHLLQHATHLRCAIYSTERRRSLLCTTLLLSQSCFVSCLLPEFDSARGLALNRTHVYSLGMEAHLACSNCAYGSGWWVESACLAAVGSTATPSGIGVCEPQMRPSYLCLVVVVC